MIVTSREKCGKLLRSSGRYPLQTSCHLLRLLLAPSLDDDDDAQKEVKNETVLEILGGILGLGCFFLKSAKGCGRTATDREHLVVVLPMRLKIIQVFIKRRCRPKADLADDRSKLREAEDLVKTIRIWIFEVAPGRLYAVGYSHVLVIKGSEGKKGDQCMRRGPQCLTRNLNRFWSGAFIISDKNDIKDHSKGDQCLRRGPRSLTRNLNRFWVRDLLTFGSITFDKADQCMRRGPRTLHNLLNISWLLDAILCT